MKALDGEIAAAKAELRESRKQAALEQVEAELESETEPEFARDRSTNELIRHYRGMG